MIKHIILWRRVKRGKSRDPTSTTYQNEKERQPGQAVYPYMAAYESIREDKVAYVEVVIEWSS